jgi:uncharacterized repeat protein (TIGR03803 family)
MCKYLQLTSIAATAAAICFGTANAAAKAAPPGYVSVVWSQAFKVLHSFSGPDGSNPASRLIQGMDNNVYGTTASGGLSSGCPDQYGCGVIFKIDKTGRYSVLHRMKTLEGGQLRGLVQTPDGLLYGVASRFGSGPPTGCGFANSCGTLFRIDTAGNFASLHNFGTTDGSYPTGGLLLGRDGFLYGTTWTSIYRTDTAGNVTTLHTFTPNEGVGLNGPLVDDRGNFYGTASEGGLSGCYLSGTDNTCGTVFKMDPAGSVTVLHLFGAGEFKPAGELILGKDGFLYGTTQDGNSLSLGGAAFRIDTLGNYKTLHIFNTGGYGPEGMRSEAGLLQVSNGMFYGTNSIDGLPVNSSNVEGTVFRMTANGAVGVLRTFTGPDGAVPFAGLLVGNDGDLYGTTDIGGATNKGTVFRLDPRARPIVAFFAFSPNPVRRGGNTTGRVTLSTPAPPGGLIVDLSNTNPGLVTVPVSVKVAAGATQATFAGTASQSFRGSVKLWASGRDGAGAVVTLTVQ